MAMFGFLKAKPVSGEPDAKPPRLADLSMQEKLFALSAILQGDTETAMKIPLLAQRRAQQGYQRAAEADLADFVGGRSVPKRPAALAPAEDLPGLDPTLRIAAPKVNVPARDPRADAIGGPVSMRAALPMLAEAARRGADVGGYVDMIKGAQPEWKYERGMRYDANDPNGGPKEITDTDKGQVRLYDADGRFAGIRNADGYVQSVAELEGAKATATEGAKAALDVGEYKDAAGVPRRMTRAQAAAALTGLPKVGGGTVAAPSLSGPSAVDITRGQSAAEAALAEGRAKNTVEVEGAAAKDAQQARFDLPKVRDQITTTLGVLEKIRKHPSLDDRTGNSTLLPAIRSKDVDFDALVDQVSGGAFLEAIQALKGSGQITEIEGKKATDAITRLKNQRQSKEGFLAAMNDYESVVRMGLSRAEKRAAGGVASPRAAAPPAAAVPPPGQRQAGQVYNTPRGPMKWTGSGWLPQ